MTACGGGCGAAGKRPSFFSNTMTLLAGNLAARALTLLLIPVITRLFAPDAFGAFAAFDALLVLLGAICHLRYPMAIFLARKRGEVRALVLLSLLVSLGFSLLAGAAVLPFREALARQWGIPGQACIFFLLGPTIFAGALSFVLLQLSTRENHFRIMAGARVLSAGVERGAGIGLGLAGLHTALPLAASRMFGLLAHALGLLLRQGREVRHALFSRGSWLRLGRVTRKYRDFAIYAPSTLLNQGVQALPPLLLAMFFAPAEVGAYALCRSVLREPINFLGEALARALYAQTSDMHRRNQPLAGLLSRFTAYSMDIVLPPLALFSVTAGPLFAFVFGERWAMAAPYVGLLAGFWALNFIARPLSCLFDLLALLRQRAFFDALVFVGGIGGLLLGASLGSPLTAVGIYAGNLALVLLWRIVWLLNKGGVPAGVFLRCAAVRLLRCAPILGLGLVLGRTLRGPLLLAGVAALLALHYALLLFLDPSLKQHTRAILKRSA